MTHSNTSTNPTTSKRGWLVPLITGAAGLTVGGLLATGITLAAADGPTGSQSECVAAIGHADDAMDLYRGAFVDASDAINAYLSNDYRSMDTYTSNINTAADDVQSVLIDYELASAECVGGSNG